MSIIENIIISDENVMDMIKGSIDQNRGLLLSYFGQHCYDIATKDKEYEQIISSNFHLYYDGFGMYLALKFLQRKNTKLFNGTDLNYEILEYLEKKKVRYYFLGGNLNDDIVNIKMSNYNFFCGYQKGFNLDENKLFKEIEKSKVKVILIGMGVPLQEKFAYKLSKHLDNVIFICVGNFFNFLFGKEKRIPQKWRNKGIEWIYRIIQNPKKMWKRYLIGIPKFIYYVLREKFSRN